MSDNPRQDWAKEQLEKSRTPQEVTTAVLRLLDVWWTQRHTPATGAATVQLFSKLAQGHALMTERDPESDAANEVWVDAKMGQLTVGNLVRVKNDAYSGDAGLQHNGRWGAIVAIRYGDIIIDYRDGREPEARGVHHPPLKLQRRIR